MSKLVLGAQPSPANEPGRVCVVDDDLGAREAVSGLLRSEGIEVEMFESARLFLDRGPKHAPHCLILDVDMPGLSGLHLQEELARANVKVPIIFVSGHADIPMSVRAVKAGAREFFTKPFDPDELLEAVRACVVQGRAIADRKGDACAGDPLAPIVGRSTALREALRQLETVAKTESTVLVHGETGTGKELVARAIHNMSARRGGPFVKVNCAAIPSGLIESELMGHEKGAFTGALARRIGRFELAQDGTIFLDEIGEIPLDLQPKLLRVLQEREFERLGSSKTFQSNARLVAATNRDLRAMVAERTFREDLYYRLSVFPLTLPPLRERVGDIPHLVEHFVGVLAARMGKDIRAVGEATMERLTSYAWPGNVRELQNVLERAVILAEGQTLEIPTIDRTSSPPTSTRAPTSSPTSSPVPPSGQAPSSGSVDSDDLASISREHILRVLDATNWVIGGPSGAAARLGLNRTTLHFRMKKLGISRESRESRAKKDGEGDGSHS